MDERQYRLTKHIINTDFDKAYEIVRNLSEEELEELMLDIGSRTMNLTVYSFMNYLLQLNETSSFHSVTSLLMAFCCVIWKVPTQSACIMREKQLSSHPKMLLIMNLSCFLKAIPMSFCLKKKSRLRTNGLKN